jgi:hypothetical protein
MILLNILHVGNQTDIFVFNCYLTGNKVTYIRNTSSAVFFK